MKYAVEFYPHAGAVPGLKSNELIMKIESDAPFPVPNIGEGVSIFQEKKMGDRWIVGSRRFLYWDQGCTLQLWCRPDPTG